MCQPKDGLQNYAVKQVHLGVNDKETQKVKILKNVVETKHHYMKVLSNVDNFLSESERFKERNWNVEKTEA